MSFSREQIRKQTIKELIQRQKWVQKIHDKQTHKNRGKIDTKKLTREQARLLKKNHHLYKQETVLFDRRHVIISYQ